MTEVKNSTPNNYSYKNHIKWFSTSLNYWSSTDYSSFPDFAWSVYFRDGGYDGSGKLNTNFVRAVLAF